jgi:outer membrane protein TolC
LQWTLGDFIAYGPTVREAALSLNAAQADRDAAVAAEKVKVVGLYLDTLKARAIAEARRSAFDLTGAQRAAAAVRVRAGDAPQLDVVRADVAQAKSEADLESARARRTECGRCVTLRDRR